jgi:hypothetical protein
MNRRLLCLALALLGTSCSTPTTPAGSTGAADTWLSGGVDERFGLVAKHLRGLDVTMVEIGHRYGELYWAVRDRNWDYARYQLEKVRTAMANGVERRPKRAASATMLEGPLAQLEATLASGNAAQAELAFAGLTATCNACHVAEKVAFIPIGPPDARWSPVQTR